jgi:hypothetical protein
MRKVRQRFMAQVADPEIVERLNALPTASGVS